MGKSLEFAKQRIATGECNGMENNKWERLNEVHFMDVYNFDTEEKRSLPYTCEYKYIVDNEDKIFTITLNYDPEAEFQYFSTSQCICDGTLMFEINNMIDIIAKIFKCETYYSPSLPNDFEEYPWRYDLVYTVGDFVTGMEIDNKFAPKDKPWMTCRFTEMLPIKMEFVWNNNE